MLEFISALGDPDIAFLRYALIAGLLASISFGIIGTYVVAQRITYIAGAIAHCVLGGIGAGLFLHHAVGLKWASPTGGALVAALIAALTVGIVSIQARQREDTVIGALWVAGMSIGLLFLARTPGYFDPMSYLFGNILLIGKKDLFLIAALDVVVVGIGILFYNKFIALCFDKDFAKTRGIKTDFYYLLLLCLTALSVFLLMRLVGLVLVIAMLTIPVAVAGYFGRRLWTVMIIAVLLCMTFITSGLFLSYTNDLPSGAMIVMVAAGIYFIVLLARNGTPLLLRLFRRPEK